MNGVDWVISGIAFFCVLRGLFRGAISQIFGIVGALGGFLLASYYYQAVAQQLVQVFPNLSGSQAIGFVLLFVLTWFCIAVLGFWTARLFYRTGLGVVDRIFGGALGLGKALILASVIISMLTLFLPPGNKLLSQSSIAPLVKEGTRVMVSLVPEQVKSLFYEKQRDFERYRPERRENGPGRNERNTQPGDPREKKEVRI